MVRLHYYCMNSISQICCNVLVICPRLIVLGDVMIVSFFSLMVKSSNPRIDKVLTQLCSSCRVGRGGGTCLALKSSQGAEKRRWSGGESVTGQLSNTRHHKIKWRLWYSFQSRQKLKLFKLLRISIFQVEGQIVVECKKYLPRIGWRSSFKYLKPMEWSAEKKLSAKINQTKEGWSAGRYYMLGITGEMVWFNLDLLGNVIYMNQKQFAFFNAMFEFLHFSYFKTQLFDWESLKSPNAITWLYEQINVINCWWGACVLEKLPNFHFQISLGEKHIAFSFSEYLSAW